MCGISNKTKRVNNSSKYGLVCGKHLGQLKKYGKITEPTSRTLSDLNTFIDYGDYVEIELYNSSQKVVATTKIDSIYKDDCLKKKWRLWDNGVFTGNNINNNPIISLQHFVFELHNGRKVAKGMMVDHKNSDRLDNRAENLREADYHQNACNKAFMSNNNSGILGVIYDRIRGRYTVEIGSSKNGRLRFGLNSLGYNDAVYVRYLCELNIFKEFRSTQNDDTFLIAIKSLSDERVRFLNEYFTNGYIRRFNVKPDVPHIDKIKKKLGDAND